VIRRYDEAKNTMKKYGVKADNVSFDLKTIMKTKEKAVGVYVEMDPRFVV
jgi:dihydrolipoyl dehydrogenase